MQYTVTTNNSKLCHALSLCRSTRLRFRLRDSEVRHQFVGLYSTGITSFLRSRRTGRTHHGRVMVLQMRVQIARCFYHDKRRHVRKAYTSRIYRLCSAQSDPTHVHS